MQECSRSNITIHQRDASEQLREWPRRRAAHRDRSFPCRLEFDWDKSIPTERFDQVSCLDNPNPKFLPRDSVCGCVVPTRHLQRSNQCSRKGSAFSPKSTGTRANPPARLPFEKLARRDALVGTLQPACCQLASRPPARLRFFEEIASHTPPHSVCTPAELAENLF